MLQKVNEILNLKRIIELLARDNLYPELNPELKNGRELHRLSQKEKSCVERKNQEKPQKPCTEN